MPPRRRKSFGGFNIAPRNFDLPNAVESHSSNGNEPRPSAEHSADGHLPASCKETKARQTSTGRTFQCPGSSSAFQKQKPFIFPHFLRRRSSIQLPVKLSEYNRTHPEFCRKDKVTIILNAARDEPPQGDETGESKFRTAMRNIGLFLRLFPIYTTLGLTESLERRISNDRISLSPRVERLLERVECPFCEQPWSSANFHSRCNSCSQRGKPLLLCGYCRHLRLDHILLCNTQAPKSIPLNMTYIDAQSGCSFCQIFTHLALVNWSWELSRGKDPLYSNSLQISRESANGRVIGHKFTFFREKADTKILNVPYATLGFRQQRYHWLVSQEVNWHAIHRQLDHCSKSHRTCQQLPSRSLPQQFYLIDVLNRQLVSAHGGPRFVALSYVWGKPDESKVQADRLSFNTLRKPGGIDLNAIPVTIRDAMWCCLFLGHRYLWTDRLCIIQDDWKSKAVQINAMDAIYSAAFIVLVEGSGTDMNSGIVGISDQRYHTSTPKAFNIPGLGALSNLLPDWPASMSGSKWMTRGWTYQEAVLARRKLVFTADQAFLICNEESWVETGNVVSNSSTPGLLSDIYLQLDRDPFSSYTRHLTAYGTRSLGNELDLCNAFVGIVNALFPESDSPLYGMPRPSFDRALLWIPEGRRPNIRQSTALLFPSWAWASAISNVVHPEFSFCGTLVKWLEIVQGDDKHSFQAIEAFEVDEKPWDDLSAGLMALAWTLGCFDRPLNRQEVGNVRDEPLSRWQTYRDFYVEAFSTSSCEVENETKDILLRPHDFNSFIPGKHSTTSLLFGRAQKAHFIVSSASSVCYNNHRTFCFIKDTKGERVGELYSGEHVAKMPQPLSHSNSCTFISLSISAVHVNWWSKRSWCTCGRCKLDPHSGRLRKTFQWEGENQPVVNVMMVESIGTYDHKRKHAYRRLNIGHILLSAWVEVDRNLEEILLV